MPFVYLLPFCSVQFHETAMLLNGELVRVVVGELHTFKGYLSNTGKIKFNDSAFIQQIVIGSVMLTHKNAITISPIWFMMF